MNYFDDPNSKHFSFESFATGLDKNTFGVVNFKGYEAISRTYDFEILMVSSEKDINLEDLLQSRAAFTIHRGGNDDVVYNGILTEFDQLHEVNDVIFYRARLVPKLWWLNLTHHNQVFLDQSLPSFVEDALRDGGLETADFEIGGLSGYDDISYICQYDESHFNFVSRWLERQGIYYYFAQEPDGEVLVLTDTKFSHESLKQGAELFYNPASGLEGKHLGEAIGTFTCRQKQLPTEIILKDYNYERPSLDITSRATVDPGGRGVSYSYGEFFSTQEEGENLATIRAEELLCTKQEFFGESTVPYIMPGFKFNLNNHYRDDFNQEYLILEVTHEGNQSHLMSGGIAETQDESQNQAIYRNSFKAMPNDVQFRPERLTEKPKISGTIHAKIDSEVDGEYAQIDEQGRYHVRLPFDINDEHMDGKGSAPIRMMQAYAGKNRGMQFPLVKGTEVLLTFIEGNPDRPVIAGAVSNPETQGPVSADNQSESVIQTGGNNKIRMEDKAGSERILLETPSAGSWIRVGAPNDPMPAVEDIDSGDGIRIQSSNGTLWFESGYGYGDYHGGIKPAETVHPAPGEIQTLIDYFSGSTQKYNPKGIFNYIGGDYADAAAATAHNDAKIAQDNAKVPYDAALAELATAEATRDQKQAYKDGLPDNNRYDSPEDYQRAQDAIDAEQRIVDQKAAACVPLKADYDAAVAVTATKKQTAVDNSQLEDILDTNRVHLRVTDMDTITTQEGNIYDFGGYWNYNLGNSYAENHMGQNVELNKKADYDLFDKGGPNFTSINWPTDCELTGINPAELWVSKSFGDSYDYKEGASINVSKGETLNVLRGGKTTEVKYNSAGKITSWSKGRSVKKWTGLGTLIYESSGSSGDSYSMSEEKQYDRNTGALFSHKVSSGTGMGLASADFIFSNKASASVDSGFNVSTKTFLGVNISNDNYVGANICNSNYVGGKISLDTYAGGKIDMAFTLAAILEIKNDELKTSFPGCSLEFGITNVTNKVSSTQLQLNKVESQLNTVKNELINLHSAALNMMN